MDMKFLITKLGMKELIEKVESDNKDKNIIYLDDLDNLVTHLTEPSTDENIKDNLIVVFCRYRSDEGLHRPEFINKVVDHLQDGQELKAFSNTYLEKIATDEKIFLNLVGNDEDSGFCLAVFSLTANAFDEETNETFEVKHEEVIEESEIYQEPSTETVINELLQTPETVEVSETKY